MNTTGAFLELWEGASKSRDVADFFMSDDLASNTSTGSGDEDTVHAKSSHARRLNWKEIAILAGMKRTAPMTTNLRIRRVTKGIVQAETAYADNNRNNPPVPGKTISLR
jgi:hypothetical protein